MRVAGIIAEYNPMHNGHIYHLEETKKISKADFVVAVMSGDFTQRGEPAILDKWERSRIAVRNGVDLVLEMPFIYATGSAPDFAYGGVGILESLGIVDTISFGSESADAGELQFMADFLKNESPEFKLHLKKHLDMGLSFPAARQIAVNECLGMDAGKLLKTPNDILAIEYLKHVRTMTPVAVKRQGSYSSEELPGTDALHSVGNKEYGVPEMAAAGAADLAENETAAVSAKAIRAAVRKGRVSEIRSFVPQDTFDALASVFGNRCELSDNDLTSVYRSEDGSGIADSMNKKYFDLLRAIILSSEKEDLAQVRGMSEGMENKIKKEIRMHADYEGFASSLKSKRYTRTSIDRLLLHVLVGLSRPYDMQTSDQAGDAKLNSSARWPEYKEGLYTRILAFNENGARLLKKASEVCSIPVVTNINKYADLPDIVKYDVKASDIYNLLTGNDLYKYSDHVMRPGLVK